nr:YjcZ family sporulation protein [Bacillus sp. EB01]
MYPNLNAPPTLGANVAPNIGPNVAPNVAPNIAPIAAPMPTYTAPVYDYGCAAPAYSYGCPTYHNDFVLIVVLFILLIIIGASCYGYSKC